MNEFTKAIDEYNKSQSKKFEEDLSNLECDLENLTVARVTYSSSTDAILSPDKDIVIPIILSRGFVTFANDLTREALLDVGLEKSPLPLAPITDDEGNIPVLEREGVDESGDEIDQIPVFWRMDSVLNWQMLDRRIDESVPLPFHFAVFL